MGARRLVLGVLVSACTVVCVLLGGAGGAAAAERLFGSEGNRSGEAGDVRGSDGLAVDGATGDVYVGDREWDRVSKFEGSSGRFLLAWGFGVLDGANEAQVCSTSCQRGRAGLTAGGFGDQSSLQGVAVDNAPLSSSRGDVYVVDQGENRVEKFDSSGKFVLMFGGHVDTTTGADVCVAGEVCGPGTSGGANGEFAWDYGQNRAYVAVGPGGRVYVGDRARVQVFEASGVWRENISLVGLSATGVVTALAVNGEGDVYVADSAVSGVHEFEPGGIEKAVQIDQGSVSVVAIALDGSGDLFVSDKGGGVHFLEYGPAGQELESFGSRTLAEVSSGLVYDEALGELLVYGSFGEPLLYGEKSNGWGVWGIPLPPAGPLVEPKSESVTPGLRGAVSFEATVIPEGNETTVRFEYVSEAQYQANGFVGASSSAPVSVGSSFEDRRVEVKLPAGTLTPGVSYRWRVVASDNASHTTSGPQEGFQETPSALVEGPWVSNLASSSATLEARIDPLGASTTYSLEWGTSTAYGQTLSGSVGAGSAYVLIGTHRQDLQPGTVYHYRVVTVNEVGTIDGPDHTFTTQIASEELTLPDGRAWELVSPPDKKAALIEAAHGTEAAADGGAITYEVSRPVGEDVVGYAGTEGTQALSTRGLSGWQTQNITPPFTLPPEGTQENGSEVLEWKTPDRLFSSDLSLTFVEPSTWTSLSPEATERTVYLRNNAICATQPQACYTPLVTPADVPPGTKFGGENGGVLKMEVEGGTPDLSHVLFSSPYALTPDAISEIDEKGIGTHGSLLQPRNLYEWSGGRLQLVNVGPNGEKRPGMVDNRGAIFGDVAGLDVRIYTHAISNDGRRIVWSYGETEDRHLYVRDMVEKRTLPIGGRPVTFEAMSGDGSRVFFLENGDLYELDVNTGTQTDLTANRGAGESNAGVQDAVLGASEDGSYVYFVAHGVLASGAVSGGDNLYVAHESAGVWNRTFIATLSSEDQNSWFAPASGLAGSQGVELSAVTSRVSPDGRFVAFMSNRSLTGYDNIDALSGKPDEEVYLYDALEGRLACASCDPTGARPVGIFDTSGTLGAGRLLTAGLAAWGGRWLAGSLPQWSGPPKNLTHQPRYLSDSGRLFFNSPDALVPQDTNGLEDAYEFEPVGVGSCSAASSGFSERSGGCVGLLSSGQSAGESEFYDASENGDDAFFITSSKLVSEDFDTAYDVYDAHVCSASAPCRSVPVSSPPCTSGDSCKAAPSLQPAIFGPAPSATFSGVGNVIEEPKSAVKHKTKAKKKRKKGKRVKQVRKKKAGGARRAARSRARAGRASGKGVRR